MICPKCQSNNVHIEDDSFSYYIPFGSGTGVEVIRYPVCEDCGFYDEENEYEVEDWEEEE